MIHVYDAPQVMPLILEFYMHAWASLGATRKVFEQIGLELTRTAVHEVPGLQHLQTVDRIYAGPIARAGCGLFRARVVDVLTTHCQPQGVSVKTFGMGLHRVDDPLHSPARVYWNTLHRVAAADLTSSALLVYDMGEATGSTIEGVVTELNHLPAQPRHIVFLLGAMCLEQTRKRLEAQAPGTNFVIGSRWRYNTSPGPTQFYLTHIDHGGWLSIPPRDWGRCVSGMIDTASVHAFISWMGETVALTPQDRHCLFREWVTKIDEPVVTNKIEMNKQ